MSLQQLIELLGLSNLELSSRSMLVVNTQDNIDILHRLSLDVRERLDLVGRVLDLLVGHLELELLDSRLDGVPSGETVTAEEGRMMVKGQFGENGGAKGEGEGERRTQSKRIESFRSPQGSRSRRSKGC